MAKPKLPRRVNPSKTTTLDVAKKAVNSKQSTDVKHGLIGKKSENYKTTKRALKLANKADKRRNRTERIKARTVGDTVRETTLGLGAETSATIAPGVATSAANRSQADNDAKIKQAVQDGLDQFIKQQQESSSDNPNPKDEGRGASNFYGIPKSGRKEL